MIAEFHKQAVDSVADAELIAVAHHDQMRFPDISKRFGVRCTSEAALLADPEVEAVIICTPSGQHAEQAINALEAGKHVLVEKPMALSLDDADEMISVAEKNGRLLAVCLQRRTETLFVRIHNAITSGDFGELTLASLILPYYRSDVYYQQADWRGTWSGDGGGVLMNQGIHLVDLLLWYMGDPIDIQAHAGTLLRHVDVEDTVGASLRFKSGALGTIAATTTAEPGHPHQLSLFGTKGGVTIRGDSVTDWLLLDPAAAVIQPPVANSSSGTGAAGDPAAIEIAGHVSIIRNFTAAIRGSETLLVDGREGRRSLSAVLGVYKSAGIRTR